MASRFLKYSVLLQKYRTPLLIASCGGVFAANIFYHVFPDVSYRQLYQAWHRGEPVVLSEKLENLFQQVLISYFFKITLQICLKDFSCNMHVIVAGMMHKYF